MVSFMEQLHAMDALAGSKEAREPWRKLLREGQMEAVRADADHWRSAVAQITGYAFPNGITRITSREMYFRLGIPPALQRSASRRVVPIMRSLGWNQRRIGSIGSRQWVWERYDLKKMRDPATPDLPPYEITPSSQDILNELNEQAAVVERSTPPARPAGGAILSRKPVRLSPSQIERSGGEQGPPLSTDAL